MKRRHNLFTKIIFVLLLLLIPISILYTYSHYTSVKVIEEELRNRNLNRLLIVRNQLDANFNQLSTLLLALSGDKSISQFKNIDIYNSYESFEIKKEILDKFHFYGGLSTWTHDFSIYAMNRKESLQTGQHTDRPEEIAVDWEFRQNKNDKHTSYFIKHLVHPINSYHHGEPSDLIMEAKFPVKNIEKYLQDLKLNRYSDPFIYSNSFGTIVSRSSNHELIHDLIQPLSEELQGESGSVTIEVGKEEYLVSFAKSHSLDWMIVDYTLLKDVLHPVTLNRNMFYFFGTVLLLLSILAAFLLYRNVQLPVNHLVHAISRVKEGDYSVRVKSVQNNDFNMMITTFNEMAEQIETLIEEVYKEKIRYQDAHVKQLQSQINPHFLYNSLFILKSMAKLNHYEGVEAMSVHLGKYYRYITRMENEYSTIREELEFIKSYLEIHVLRMQRLIYKINVPEEMLDIPIPRLLIQPIVENAFIHGIDSRVEEGKINIIGDSNGGEYKIIIEDNGKGLSAEEIASLIQKINLPMNKDTGCGVWNVHQRLFYHFGEGAGLGFTTSTMGGLRVMLCWKEQEINKGELENVQSVNCG